jgi:hypothetical protein
MRYVGHNKLSSSPIILMRKTNHTLCWLLMLMNPVSFSNVRLLPIRSCRDFSWFEMGLRSRPDQCAPRVMPMPINGGQCLLLGGCCRM